jgi:hypothetical protein
MITRNIITFLLLFCVSVQGQINTFLKTFSATPGYNTTEYLFSGLDTLSKNSFITAGCKMRSPLNSSDTLVVDGYIQKTEISGLTKWFRSYHINGHALSFQDVKVISNKEIIAVGHTDNFGNPNANLKHGIILKTDSSGYPIWCRLYPRQKIYNILRRSDGNIGIVASDSGNFLAKNLKLALLNPAGNLIWCKRLMSSDSDFYSIHIKEGINKSFIINNEYSLMILIDSSGNHVNDISYNPPSAAHGFHNVINYYNQYYYITGLNTNSSNKLLSTITKTDAALNIIWHKNYQSSGGDSEFHNIVALAPNNLMVFCEPENYGTYPYLQRSGFAFFDSSGTFKKSHLFTSDTFPILPYDLIPLRNGKFLFTAFNSNILNFFGIVDTTLGTFCKQTQINWNNVSAPSPVNTNSFTCVNAAFNYSVIPVYVYNPIDATIEYVCSNGPTGPLDSTAVSIQEEEYDNNSLNIFPIPTQGILYVDFNIKIEKRNVITLKLFNSLGQLLMNNRTFLESKYLPLDLRNFPNGVYYLTIMLDPEKTIIKKIILTKN